MSLVATAVSRCAQQWMPYDRDRANRFAHEFVSQTLPYDFVAPVQGRVSILEIIWRRLWLACAGQLFVWREKVPKGLSVLWVLSGVLSLVSTTSAKLACEGAEHSINIGTDNDFVGVLAFVIMISYIL